MYKVFINDRTLILTDNLSDYTSDFDTLFIHYASDQAFFESIDLLNSSNVVKQLCVYSDDLSNLWKKFASHYKNIKAAGGIVQKDGKVLMILKNGFWDLPKGKVDNNELTDIAAIREVTEECGLKSLSIQKELPVTYYLFTDKNELVLKETKWFLMTSETDGPLKGDEKEGITEVRWIDKKEWEEASRKSYLSVIELMSSIL